MIISRNKIIYSGHDSTLTAEELFMIKFFDDKIEYRYPTYTTQLAFEVTRDEKRENLNYSSYKVSFYFNEDVLIEKNFEEFKNIIEKKTWNEEKVSEFCDGKKNDDKHSFQIFVIIGLSILSLIFLMIIIFLVMKIKNMKNISDNSDKNRRLVNGE